VNLRRREDHDPLVLKRETDRQDVLAHHLQEITEDVEATEVIEETEIEAVVDKLHSISATCTTAQERPP
jgi:hypothetical protein